MKKRVLQKAFAFFCAVICALGSFACQPTLPKEEITVYMPDGAPALALAQLMYEDEEGDGITYRVVDSSLISSKVTNESMDKNADLCVMPVTAASKLLGAGENYTMLGTVTHGNLYLIAKTEEFTWDGLSSLVGKKVGVLQMNNVPGLTLKTVLNKYDIPWQEVKNGDNISTEKVNLFAITGADAVGVEEADCFMLAEPAVSAQAKKGYTIVGDLQVLYGGENGYPQAVLVAKNELLETNADWTVSFVEKVAQAANWVKTASGEQLVATVTAHMEDAGAQTSLKAPMLSTAVVGRCGIRFTYASQDRDEVSAFLTEMLLVNDKAAAIPAEKFYWNYTK